MRRGIAVALGLLPMASVLAAEPTTWVTSYGGYEIRFNDWGYVGPSGVGANDFQVGGGFDSTRVGQIQDVLTLDPNWQTLDPGHDILIDMAPAELMGTAGLTYTNASMDATVNFYAWAYTTVGGSRFDDMMIDRAGNYFVARDDMHFQFYDVFQYHDVTGANPDSTRDTMVNFQPYAVSDARGWCGSVLTSDPNALEVMAGQVAFDFAFDAYLNDGVPVSGQGGGTQIVPDFVMRSYGSYEVDFGNLQYSGSAVMNNNDPTVNPLDGNGEVTDAAIDPAWQNYVSFLGAGVVPQGVWVTADSFDGTGTTDSDRVLNADSTWNLTVAGEGAASICDPANPGAAPVPGAVCWQNSFAGYPFLMRADGQRTVTYINPEGWTDYAATAVPVPAAVWLLGSGLLFLVGTARRKRG